MKVGSLFAGVGGFDIAAERAGMEVVWQSEVDSHASKVLEHHWPGRNLGDIHNIRLQRNGGHTRPAVAQGDITDTEGRIRDRGVIAPGNSDSGGTDDRITAPTVDVLCGGFPCQDYSVAGNREGLAGDRGALWWEFHRLIAEGRPTWVVGENVAGLLSSRGGADFATIVDSLVELGYGVAWGVLDAQFFGVAQRRRRVFIVGHSGGQPRPEVLALSEGVFGHPAPSREKGQGTTEPVAVGSHGSGDITGSLTTAFDSKNYSNLQEVSAGSLVAFHATQEPINGPVAPRLGANATVGVAFAQNQRDELRDLKNVAGALAAEPGMKQQTYVATSIDRYNQTTEEDIHHALRTGSGDAEATVQQGMTVRRLTPLECERLQGFPDGWTDVAGMSDSQRYKQMGNAVAVPVVEWIMGRVASTHAIDNGSVG